MNKNPQNLQEAFAVAALETGLTSAQVQGRWYTCLAKGPSVFSTYGKKAYSNRKNVARNSKVNVPSIRGNSNKQKLIADIDFFSE